MKTSPNLKCFYVTISVLGLFLCTPSWSQDFLGPFDNDAAKLLSPYKHEIGSPQRITPQPPIANLPFLKLRRGDFLVRGYPQRLLFKGKASKFYETPSNYVCSNGKYYDLGVTSKNESRVNIDRGTAYYSIFFTWEVNLANATAIHKLDGDDMAIAFKSYPELRTAIKRKFPEAIKDKEYVDKAAPHLEKRGNAKVAVFEGLAFDDYSNSVFKYQLILGDGIYRCYRNNLIVGPKRVERWTFEGVENNGTINGPAPYTPDPDVAARQRGAYEKTIEFRTIVNKFLVKPMHSVAPAN